MTDVLEAKLRDALARHAAEIPDGASERLRRIDYRPRRHALGRPAAFGAFAGALATAGAIVAVIGLGAGASNAFAGWTPSPAAAATGQTANAIASCRSRLTATSAPPGTPGPTPTLSSSGLTPVLTDARGPFTFVIFAGGDSDVSCISGPSFSAVSGSSGPGVLSVPAGHVQLSSQHFTTRNGKPYTVVEGHTAAGVARTTLLLSDGSRVTASIGNGWFAAWWPGGAEANAAMVTTSAGTVTQPLATHGAVRCGQGPCSGGGVMSGGRGSEASGVSVMSGGSEGSGRSTASAGG